MEFRRRDPRVRWWWALVQTMAAFALELVGILPREECQLCAARLGPIDNYCSFCGVPRGEKERG